MQNYGLLSLKTYFIDRDYAVESANQIIKFGKNIKQNKWDLWHPPLICKYQSEKRRRKKRSRRRGRQLHTEYRQTEEKRMDVK